MFNPILARPITDPNTAAHYRRQLHWLFFLRVLLLTLLLGISILLHTTAGNVIIPPLPYIGAFIAGIYLYTIGSALVLKYVRRYTTFSYTQVLLDSLLISLLVYFSGASESIFVTVFFFPIIAGSFILQRRGGLAVAAANTLGYGLILVLELNGRYPAFFDNYWYVPIEDIMVVMHYFSIHGITFFLVAILSALLSERLRKTEKALSQTVLQYDRLSLLYKQIFDDVATGIITVNTGGQVTSFNQASEAITGFTAAEVMGRDIGEQLPQLKFDGLVERKPLVELTRKDGGQIAVACTVTGLNMPGDCDDCQVITLQDLSEIKKMEEQMRQAEKMAAIGEMAAGVAHEFRNPLAAISGSVQVLNRSVDMNAVNQGLMDIIIRECNRLEASVSDFLQFSKPAIPEKEWLSIKKLITEAVQILRRTPDWPDFCELKLEIPEKMDCWGDAQQLHRVISNLLHNSCLAIDGLEGKITISASEQSCEDGSEMTVLRVADTGCGIPPEIAPRIFEPFFTTRDNGTGLGLAIVQQIIEGHEGTISITSEPREGTMVEIRLPLPQ